MRWADVQVHSVDLLATVDELLHWWLEELRELLPGGVWKYLGRERQEIILDILPDQAIVSAQSKGRSRNLGSVAIGELDIGRLPPALQRLGEVANGPVLVRFPEGRLFRKTIELPIAARGKLRVILGHEIERQTPLQREHVEFDYRIVSRSDKARTLKVELVVIKKDVLNCARAIAASLGLTASRFAVIDDSEAAQRYRFDAKEFALKLARPTGRLLYALVILASICGASFLVAGRWHAQQAETYRQTQVDQLRAAAQSVSRLRGTVKALANQIQFLAQEKSKPMLVRIVTEVTSILPDGVWLDDLTVDGSAIRLQGYAPAAAGLIELFDKSSFFRNARFAAPVTQGPRNSLERFDISIDLKEGTAK